MQIICYKWNKSYASSCMKGANIVHDVDNIG